MGYIDLNSVLSCIQALCECGRSHQWAVWNRECIFAEGERSLQNFPSSKWSGTEWSEEEQKLIEDRVLVLLREVSSISPQREEKKKKSTMPGVFFIPPNNKQKNTKHSGRVDVSLLHIRIQIIGYINWLHYDTVKQNIYTYFIFLFFNHIWNEISQKQVFWVAARLLFWSRFDILSGYHCVVAKLFTM